MRKSFTVIALLMLSSVMMAQEENEFAIDAQLRARSEYNNGAINPRAEHEMPASFTNNRARLSMDWKRNNLELKASVQHVGVWGQDNIKEQNGRVAMNEAWGKFTFGSQKDSHSVKIGRQKLVYDDERILGGLDWNVAGNWHDAILYEWKSIEDSYRDNLNIAIAYNQDRENVRGGLYNGGMPYKQLFMTRYHIDMETVPLGLSLLAMNVGRESATTGNSDTKQMQIGGVDVSFKPAALDIHGAFYYESGKNVNDQDIAAWMATARLGYAFSEKWSVFAAYDYMSGSDGTGDKQKTFDPLFGTHHKFLGSMDYFTAIPQQGLSDIQAGVSTKAVKKLDMQLNYHYFMLNEKTGDLKKELGHELDFQLSTRLMDDVTLSAGYSFMLGTETMDAVKGGYHKSWQDWGWVQLNINPRVLFAKW